MGCTSKYWPYFRRYRWIHREVVAFGDVWPNIQIYRCADDPIRQKSTCWPCFQTIMYIYIGSNWWFHPPWKILVRLDHHPNYWGQYKKRFQTTNQYIICVLWWLFPHRTIICCEVRSWALHFINFFNKRRWRQHETMKPWTCDFPLNQSYPIPAFTKRIKETTLNVS